MKPIKKRWHMWKHYTNKYDKALHGAMALLATLHIVGAAIAPSVASWSAAGVFTWLTCTLILKDVWRETYLKTETLRSLGAHVGEALQTYTFIKASNMRGTYRIEPDLPAIDPDAIDDDIYTDEIVIRRGMSADGDPLIAWSIPEDLETETVLGMLEHAKLQYSYDILADPHE